MIVVTGATGHLGTLVVRGLAARVPAGEVVAAVRDPKKAEGLAALGVQVREADYDRPETLGPALEGAEKVLLISGSEPGRRVPQHRAVVEAAKAAGVRHLAYTGILGGPETDFPLADDHKGTEEVILASGLAYTFLRNGWYTENYTGDLSQVFAQGPSPRARATGGWPRRRGRTTRTRPWPCSPARGTRTPRTS
ncbi:NAD(P)H-binding protein [Thermocatellispora tengchongensis]|uniref:NAD(P)H-binding protein n=1 Tax=Thermocatellispora tengchongensis TaxID=1073253 RepID=UPI00362BD91B